MMSILMPSDSFFAQVNSRATWDIEKLNTAKDVKYLSELEKEVILEINMVRTNPEKYAEIYIKPLLQFYEGLYFRYPGQVPVITAEGKSALLDCVDALNEADPVGILHASKGLTRSSQDLMRDQGRSGKVGHTGGDGSNPFERMKRYGEWKKTAAENVDYGNNSARWIVLSLLIDDGVPGRGHRKNLLNGVFSAIGIAYGPHPYYGHMCVMDMAGEYIEK
ncbi:CAP domain-containing protein [Saccharicrinis sp. FJH62]|uniref:CAP domain-containing protein n=1 Tax=Saccharicrinis sp. FJH62 TaxID=3344657 RepID=UPI0035D4E832